MISYHTNSYHITGPRARVSSRMQASATREGPDRTCTTTTHMMYYRWGARPRHLLMRGCWRWVCCIVLYCIVLYCIVLSCVPLTLLGAGLKALHRAREELAGVSVRHDMSCEGIVDYIRPYRIVSYRIASYRIESYHIKEHTQHHNTKRRNQPS